jgi:hypothetical protein
LTIKPQMNGVSGYRRRNEQITDIGWVISPESLLKAFFGTVTTTAIAGPLDFFAMR